MKKAHFIGICGAGMSAVALLLKERGWTISGSDEGFYPPISEMLTQCNLPCKTPYHPDNIPADVVRIIIGKNAKLVPETNEEVAEAFKRQSQNKSKVVSFPEILEELTADTHNIVVAGSYGKSTCTALISHILCIAGKDPSYFIGASPKDSNSPAHNGSWDVFVLEGDEYPSSNWDARSKFLYYNARDVLLASATHDHVNVYPTLKDYHLPFQNLIDGIPQNGLLVACADEKYAQSFFNQFIGRKVSYGLTQLADYYAENISYEKETSFDLCRRGEVLVPLKTSLLGAHNIENIIGCCALLLERKLVTSEELREGVSSFKGLVRRLDKLFEKTTIPMYEGFGTSKEKALSAIAAMKLHFPSRELLIIFEPHTFTWRNKEALPHYKDTFSNSSVMFVYEPATQGSHTHEQLTQKEIVSYLQKHGTNAHAIQTKENLLNGLKEHVSEKSVILFLTSGDLGGLMNETVTFVEETFPLK